MLARAVKQIQIPPAKHDLDLADHVNQGSIHLEIMIWGV